MTAIRSRALIAFVAFLTLLWFSSCRDHGCCDDRSYGVTGEVTDSLTEMVIDSAKVTLFDTTDAFPPWLTDTTGRYAVQLYGDSATLFVRKEGFRTESRELRGVDSDISGVDFKLIPE